MDPETHIALSKTSYRTLFDSLPGALLIVEFCYAQAGGPVERRILDVNSEFEAFCGLSRDELIGRKTIDLFPPPSGDWFELYMDGVKGEETKKFVRFCEKTLCWYDVSVVPLEEGEKCAIIFVDITAEKKEAELQRKIEARQNYFIALGHILRTLDGANNIQEAVLALLCQYLGVCRATFVAGSPDQFVVDDGETGKLIVPIMRHGEPTAHLVVVPNSPRVWIRDERVVAEATAQRTWQAVEKARTHEALLESERTALALVEELKAADHSKNEMIAILSHELRNPMAVMAAALDLFELDSEDSQSQRMIATMRSQIEQLTKIVDDLRNLARISTHGLQLTKQRVDLRLVVENALRGLGSVFDDKGVKLAENIPTQPIIVRVDTAKIVQSLQTVLVHALNFTPPNGTVALVLDYDEDYARIKIRDEGPGLSPGLLTNVFEPFVQAGSPIRRKVTGGVGVGLAIVKDVFVGHNGWVDANNHPSGRGAVFTLGLPLAGDGGGGNKANATGKDNLEILCIEDNAELAQLLQTIFAKLGHEAHLAYSGNDGLAKAKELVPDIIFCDVGLEDISGLDVARQIRKSPKLKDTFLVALTGYASKQDKLRAKQSGFDLHVAKPFKLATIEHIVANYTAAKE